MYILLPAATDAMALHKLARLEGPGAAAFARRPRCVNLSQRVIPARTPGAEGVLARHCTAGVCVYMSSVIPACTPGAEGVLSRQQKKQKKTEYTEDTWATALTS